MEQVFTNISGIPLNSTFNRPRATVCMFWFRYPIVPYCTNDQGNKISNEKFDRKLTIR